MRVRYITEDRRRLRVLTNDVEQLSNIHRQIVKEGFIQVGLVRFLIHLLTAGKRGHDSTRHRKANNINP